MESTNLHHQDQPPTPEPCASSSSSSLSTTTATPSPFHGAALGGTNHSWTPNFILNAGGNPRSRVASTDNNDIIGVPLRPLIQDSGYHHHWTTGEDALQSCLTTNNQSTTHHHLDQLRQQQHLSSKIKEEINLPKFSSSDCEMLNITPSSMEAYRFVTTTTSTTATTHHMKNIIEHHKDNNNNADDDLNEKLLLKALFSGDLYSSTNNAAQNNYYPHHNFGSNSRAVPSRGGNFSQIYPSINISNLNRQPSSNSTVALVSSPAMESLDLLTSPSRSFISTDAGLSRHHHHHSHQDLGRFADNLSFRLDHMQRHTIDRSFCTSASNSSNPSSHFPNGTAEGVAKRPCTSSMELESSSKASQSQTATKKSRSESRPSHPPFKVRKEKLGDRIAALQQLVAPFGKTDTASVLMEAIGYIKFLQSQVETLSVPYMKSSQNQTNRAVMQGVIVKDSILNNGSGCIGGDGNGEEKRDLRSRGLCLVPLSCMSYIAGDGGTDVWQQ